MALGMSIFTWLFNSFLIFAPNIDCGCTKTLEQVPTFNVFGPK